MSKDVRQFQACQLSVEVHSTRAALGQAAGSAAADHLRSLLSRQPEVRVIFACAPSQNEFLAALTSAAGIDWARITAFHMDEYVGLAARDPASFRRYLHEHLCSRVPLRKTWEIGGDAPDAATECDRYASLLRAAPIDVVCMGIGENGHVAFNDPPVADFNDPLAAKVVALDDACRQQQVNDGCFPAFDAVPRQAITLTVPTLMSGARIFCMVPGPRKAAAVKQALEGPIAEACPGSVLRRHAAAQLFLDRDSAVGLEG